MNYKKAYLHLFNEVTDLIEQLKQIQIDCEEICISEEFDEKDSEEEKEIVHIIK